MAKVDIVIPCYNYGRFLEECVQSVLAQSLRDLRVLIIDDASSDESVTVAAKLAEADQRVSVVAHPQNRGHIATYNEGLLEWADADYSVLLSADDVLTPGSLARAAAVLDANPSVGMVYGHALFWNANEPRPIPRLKATGTTIWPRQQWLRIVCRRGHAVTSTPGVVVRTSVQRAIGGYRPELPHTGDFEMWMRFAVHSDIAYVRGADQSWYRIHDTNMTTERIPIVDFRQRKAAYDYLFGTYGALIRHRDYLKRKANRKMAKQALRWACSAHHRGCMDTIPVAELRDFAQSTCAEFNSTRILGLAMAAAHRAGGVPVSPTAHAVSRPPAVSPLVMEANVEISGGLRDPLSMYFSGRSYCVSSSPRPARWASPGSTWVAATTSTSCGRRPVRSW